MTWPIDRFNRAISNVRRLISIEAGEGEKDDILQEMREARKQSRSNTPLIEEG